jgi:hypothetical protein
MVVLMVIAPGVEDVGHTVKAVVAVRVEPALALRKETYYK